VTFDLEEEEQMPRNGAGGSRNSVPTKLTAVPLVPIPEPRGPGKPVDIDQIAPNPRNLREDDLWPDPAERDAMVASFKSVGLIQPLIVCDVEAFSKAYPDYSFGEEIRYVVLAGHCRLDAAPDGGLTKLKIDVQNDLVPKMDEVFLQENLRRVALNPLHEALGYDRIARARDLSNQKVADILGISKSVVVKRRALLKVDDEGKSLIRTGAIGVDDAYNLIAALGEQTALFSTAVALLQADPERTPKDAAALALNPPAPETAEDSPSAAGETEPLVPGQRAEDESTAPTDQEPPASATGTGTAPASPPPAAPTDPSTGAAPQEPSTRQTTTRTTTATLSSEDHQRAAATSARDKACLELVETYVDVPGGDAADRIAAVTLANATTAGLTLAHRWMCAAKAPHAEALSATSYRDTVLFGDDPTSIRKVAYALALAEEEVRASDRRRKWGPRAKAHLQHLVDAAGYVPTEWEQRQL